MRKLPLVMIICLMLFAAPAAAFAEYTDVVTDEITMVSDLGVRYYVKYPDFFRKSSTRYTLYIDDYNIKTVKGLSPQGTIQTRYVSEFPVGSGSKEHNLANGMPDDDCTKKYEYTYRFGIDRYATVKVDFKFTRSAKSAHD